jgi:hypothetical protein
MECILHFMYVVAIKNRKAWNGFSPAQIAMLGFWNLIIVWLKVSAWFSASYRLLRIGLFSHIERSFVLGPWMDEASAIINQLVAVVTISSIARSWQLLGMTASNALPSEHTPTCQTTEQPGFRLHSLLPSFPHIIFKVLVLILVLILVTLFVWCTSGVCRASVVFS